MNEQQVSSAGESYWRWHGLSRAPTPLVGPLILERLQAKLGEIRAASAEQPPRASPPHSTPGVIEEFARCIGTTAAAISGDDLRLRHAYGQSYPELVLARAGTIHPLPDAVVRPTEVTQAEAILAAAARLGLRVVVYGGGTSVTGALIGPSDPYIVVSTQRLARIGEIDRVSRLAVLGAGLTGPDIERALATKGLTLGHFPQSFERSTLGGWIATRSVGQASGYYGRIEEMLSGVELVSPTGRLRTRPGPPVSTGPRILELIAGAEGTLGVITEAVMRVRPGPERRRYFAAHLETFEQGLELAREVLQEGARLAVLRIADEDETRFSMDLAEDRASGVLRFVQRQLLGVPRNACLLVAIVEGDTSEIDRAGRIARALIGRRARILPEAIAERWAKERFTLPYLRDYLIEHDLIVETFDTSAPWSLLPGLYRRFRETLGSGVVGPALIGCHLSHAYETGAGLYFTVLAQADGDPIGRWWQLKRVALDAITRSGGAVSHQHGIGADHAPWLAEEHGSVGIAAIAALRSALDPQGIMGERPLDFAADPSTWPGARFVEQGRLNP